MNLPSVTNQPVVLGKFLELKFNCKISIVKYSGPLVHDCMFFLFGLQTEEFDKILFLFSNSALGDKYDHDYLSPITQMWPFFSKIVEQIKFVNCGTTVCATYSKVDFM